MSLEDSESRQELAIVFLVVISVVLLPRLFRLNNIRIQPPPASISAIIPDIAPNEEPYIGTVYSEDVCNRLFEKEPQKHSCIQIKKFARWGNNVIQFLRTLQMSKVCGFSTLYRPPGFLDLGREDIKIDNITVKVSYSANCYHQHFYGNPHIEELDVLDLRLPMDFKLLYNKKMGVVPRPDDELVIHIRGEDIMRRRAWFSYGQPPCSYYKEIIESRKWGNVTVVTQDYRNPCVKTLEGLAQLRVGKPWSEDLRILLGARNLVIGRGSLGYMVAVLSVNIHTLYTCNSSSTRFLKLTCVKKHINCIPSDEYYNLVIKHYSGSPEQIDAMPHGKCAAWEDLAGRPLDRVHVHETVV